jgi:hypothetical protein
MSALGTNTLTDAAGSNSMAIADINQGRAKAWWSFNGTGTIALRDSFNVASLVDNGTGDYTVNLTTAFANANWTAGGVGWGGSILAVSSAVAPAAGAVRLITQVNGGAALDPDYVRSMALGDS